jgi:hypothetical protein
MRIVIIISAVGIMIMCWSCASNFAPGDYYPLRKGAFQIYSGPVGKVQIIDELPGESGTFYTASFGDTLGSIFWTEKYVSKEGQIFWENFQSEIAYVPSISFDPPIEIAPISDQVGTNKSVETKASQEDSTLIVRRIRVDYEIEAIEDVKVSAGAFGGCIRMRTNITYLDATDQPLLEGNNIWWFARGVGIVKYVTASGEGELISSNSGLRIIN